MRKFLSGFFLALLCFAVSGESQNKIVDLEIKFTNKHFNPFNSTLTDAIKAGGSSSDANIYSKISAAKESKLLVYSASFLPTKIAAGSNFTSRFTQSSSRCEHKVGPERNSSGNATSNQGCLFLYRARTIDCRIRCSGAVITV